MRAPSLPVYLALLTLAACGVEQTEPVGAQRSALRDLDTIEAEFLRLLNDYRVANGLDAVMADRALNQGARDYSQLMGENAWFDHTGPDGSSFDGRMCDAGYTAACGPRTYVAENIAAGQRTAAAVFEAWRTSPGHNRNMLSSSAVVVGIGRAEVSGSPYGVYWTNTFAGQVSEHTVPNEVDAGPIEPPDAGPPPEPDAGPPPEPDAGTPVEPDAGAVVFTDAGTDTGDAAVGVGVDAAGRTDPPLDGTIVGGCASTGARSGEAPLLLLFAVLAIARVRRRR